LTNRVDFYSNFVTIWLLIGSLMKLHQDAYNYTFRIEVSSIGFEHHQTELVLRMVHTYNFGWSHKLLRVSVPHPGNAFSVCVWGG